MEGGNYGSQPMKVPNVYLKEGASQQVDLVRVFGSLTNVTCEVANPGVAEVSASNTALTVKGLATGSTKATVTVTTAGQETVSQTFVITVRNSSGNGWM